MVTLPPPAEEGEGGIRNEGREGALEVVFFLVFSFVFSFPPPPSLADDWDVGEEAPHFGSGLCERSLDGTFSHV